MSHSQISASVSESVNANEDPSSTGSFTFVLLPLPNTLPSLAPSPENCLVSGEYEEGLDGDFDGVLSVSVMVGGEI